MKIAVRNPDGSEGWEIVDPKPGTIAVFVDGQKIDRCVAADDSAGEVWVNAVDENGQFILNEAHDAVQMEKRTGKVEIRMLLQA